MLGTSGIVGPSILHGGGRGLLRDAGGERPGQRRLLRRWRGEQRRVSRGAEHGDRLGAAGPVRLREQPVRDRGAVRHGRRNSRAWRPARASYGIAGVERRRQRRAGGPPGGGRGGARARAGGGPTLLECNTYRTRPHSEGMRDGGYRTVEEIDAWKDRDPIVLCASISSGAGSADEAALDAIDAAVAATVPRRSSSRATARGQTRPPRWRTSSAGSEGERCAN